MLKKKFTSIHTQKRPPFDQNNAKKSCWLKVENNSLKYTFSQCFDKLIKLQQRIASFVVVIIIVQDATPSYFL